MKPYPGINIPDAEKNISQLTVERGWQSNRL